ncbi:MAG: hypothetical protein OQL08_12340 [Gammaproteobacteria bacterium]|nr:hypothetical protein [Gammaproteobacteria bacterium]
MSVLVMAITSLLNPVTTVHAEEGTAWSDIKEGAKKTWGGVKEGSREAWGDVKGESKEVAGEVTQGSKGAWQSIKELFTGDES